MSTCWNRFVTAIPINTHDIGFGDTKFDRLLAAKICPDSGQKHQSLTDKKCSISIEVMIFPYS